MTDSSHSTSLGLHEERTRIWLYLPHNNPCEALACMSVFEYLKDRRKRCPDRGRVTGFTQSKSLPTAYEGWWWGGRKGWVRDHLIVVIIDHECALADVKLRKEIDALKRIVVKSYREEKCPQEEVWLVAHPAWRYD